jgi:hypothetical protein
MYYTFLFVCTMTSFIEVLRNNISNDKYTVYLSQAEIHYIDTLLSSKPEVFGEIQTTVDGIIGDGKIDVHDLPNIVLLVTQIYRANLLAKLASTVNMVQVVRFTIDTLLDSGIILLPQYELIIIRKVVDTSLDLLATNIVTIDQDAKSCWAWLYRLWCGCCSRGYAIMSPPHDNKTI